MNAATGISVELFGLARRVRHLAPDHRDPERFHEEKDEIAQRLRALAGGAEQRSIPQPLRPRPVAPTPPDLKERHRQMKWKLTRQIVYAAGQDAGNRSMRAAGRTAWNEDDWNAASAEYERLIALLDDQPNPLVSLRKRCRR